MGKIRIVFLLFLSLSILSCQQEEIHVRLAVTTDVHGMIFPYDFTRNTASDNSLAHVYQYAREARENRDTLFILLDNGDFLQGQPTVYYSNFVDSASEHLAVRVMNYMGYAAGTVGNHDIEAGPEVYYRVREGFSFPWLAANAVSTDDGAPVFDAYTILKAGKKRIAILGLITPGIPNWLPPNLWPGMEFRDMVETARYWVPYILENEEPDLLVGLFHSGTDASYGGATENHLNENAVRLVAEQVPGFDLIYAGHDHQLSIEWLLNTAGDSVLIVDPASHARFVGEVLVSFGPGGKKLRARNVPMKDYEASEEFTSHFEADRNKVAAYLSDTVTMLKAPMEALDALFGPSSLISLIHQVQLDLSGADISFTAPLSLHTRLNEGPLLVSDMFSLYRYENMLYTMALSGSEIKGFLEHAVAGWFSTMDGPGDPLLNFSTERPGRLAEAYYNFSSASGIDYTVNVSKDPGQRINISRFSDGKAFYPDSIYRVALNSYRGNGGGGHLTRGAGIDKEDLTGRILASTDVDLRLLMMDYLKTKNEVRPESHDNWSCLPETWVKKAAERDRKKLE